MNRPSLMPGLAGLGAELPTTPLSYSQQWGTFYAVLAGPRPLSVQEVVGMMTPWLSDKLKTNQLPAVKSAKVTVIEDPTLGPTIVTKPFQDRMVPALNYNVVTGIKWNLRKPDYSKFTDQFAGSLRAGWRTTGRRVFRNAGFKDILFSINPYNKVFGKPQWGGGITDYRFPATPKIPPPPTKKEVKKIVKKIIVQQQTARPLPQQQQQQPTPVIIAQAAPATVKTSAMHWFIGGLAMLAVALASRRINGGASPALPGSS